MIARERIKALNPDVITLDVEMPNMDGLTFLRKIMTLRPMPVIMISTLTQAGADVTLEALEIGAVDFIAKPSNDAATCVADCSPANCRAKVKAAARTRVGARARGPRRRPAAARPVSADPARSSRSALRPAGSRRSRSVLMDLPSDCPPILDHPAHAAALHRGFRAAAEPRMPDAGVGSGP